jgi:transposase
MNEKNLDEIAYRRKAFKLFDKGKSTKEILQLIPRSRSWLFKWKRRFQEAGWKALDSLPKTPKHSPQKYKQSVVKTVLVIRDRLKRARVGLVGARAIFFELKKKQRLKAIPSLTTIKRWLREAGRFEQEAKQREVYYPAPHFSDEILYLSCDWVARYLEGGEKVFCFHTLDQRTHALYQSIADRKTAEVACQHLLESSKELGIADFLQVDNDAAFTGLGRKERVFGKFVRLCLYLGTELLFIPQREPKRNSLVERVNGLWSGSFFDKDHFSSSCDLKRKRGKFLKWYQTYTPPSLNGLSVKDANRKVRRRKLGQKDIKSLPERLPLVEGRIHFVRRVDLSGKIEILKEKFKVSKRLKGEYVWATIDLKRQNLSIFYRSGPKAKARKLKQYLYDVGERVEKMQPRFKHRITRVSVLKII